MSLLKRISGTGPMPNGGDGTPNGTDGLSRPGTTGGTNQITSSPTNVIPRAGTGRLPGTGEVGTAQGRPNAAVTGDNFLDLKNRVQHKLIAELDPKLDLTNTDEVRRNVEEIFNDILDHRKYRAHPRRPGAAVRGGCR